MTKINIGKKDPVSAVSDAVGKVSDAAKGIVGNSSRRGNSTKRHAADMASDNQLSKSIRPIITIWSFILFTAILVLEQLGHPVDPEIKSTIKIVLGLTVGFYFPTALAEKWVKEYFASKKK